MEIEETLLLALVCTIVTVGALGVGSILFGDNSDDSDSGTKVQVLQDHIYEELEKYGGTVYTSGTHYAINKGAQVEERSGYLYVREKSDGFYYYEGYIPLSEIECISIKSHT